MNKNSIYVTQPFLPPLEEFEAYLKDIWDTKWVTNNGKYHQRLESALCDYLGVKYISLFSNGTLALITALQALKITGEVITTPFSFVATAHSIWWNNIKPVFADVDPEYFNLDPDRVEAAITPQTTAIMPVHVYGNPCQVDKLKKIADTYGLKLIYDACHTFGVKTGGQSVLNFGDLSVMSFHATKVYNTFEGGAIVCHDEATKKRIDFLKNFGFADETIVVTPGINAKMNEFQAALGLLQLKYVDGAIQKRKDITTHYWEKLKGIPGLSFMNDMPGVRHCYPYFPVLIDEKEYGLSRDAIYEEMKRHNIFGRRYFYPLISQFPAYKGLPSARAGNLPVAEKVAGQVICLPLYSELDLASVEVITKLLRR
jgi:dTDP-4-amino-4,6-dideoxygalactose transaminase